MMNVEQIEALLEPVAQSLGYELVACEWTSEFGKKILRVYIDQAAGIKLEDCEKFSKLVDPLLDVETEIPEAYDLEVSSPGLARPLRKLKDFDQFKGRWIRLKTKTPLEGRANYKGVLEGTRENNVLIVVDGFSYEIPHSLIEKAHIEPSREELFQNKNKRREHGRKKEKNS